MILYRTGILLVCFILSIGGLHAQNISTAEITWHVDELTELKSGSSLPRSSTFITKPNSIDWIQKNGAKKYEFTIVKVTGTWPNVKEDGDILFDVKLSDKPGKIRVFKDKSGYRIKLDYTMSEQEILQYEFHISHFEVR